jgi:hypothetical protein
MPFTSFTMRREQVSSSSYGRCAQWAVMKSTVSTALSAMTGSWRRPSPVTPTLFTGRNTANAWLVLSYQPDLRSSSM